MFDIDTIDLIRMGRHPVNTSRKDRTEKVSRITPRDAKQGSFDGVGVLGEIDEARLIRTDIVRDIGKKFVGYIIHIPIHQF